MLGSGFSERYEIKDRIGQGGMGEVYRAFDRTTGRDVTIKTLLDFRDDAALEQFRHECRVLASLNHSNIVDIYDLGEYQGRPYFVMPLLPGQTLGELLQSETLSVQRVIDIISQACRGLQAAHEKGLIHRDLKPSNLFILPGDSVKLIDFGVAGVMDTRSTMKLKGTLLYMSPEQTELKPLTPQADLFSLAIVTYEALAGRRPFEGANAEQIIRAIRKDIPPPVCGIRPEVGDPISQVVHKALAKPTNLRFSSVSEYASCLQKALHNQPIEYFNEERIQSRLKRVRQAVESGEFELAADIVSTVESETYHPEVVQLRRRVDQSIRERKIQKHLVSARQRFEVEEDELALERVQAVLELDAGNPEALGIKAEIEKRTRSRQIDRWVALARQHLENHAYPHAREAIDKALALDARHAGGLTLLNELERREQEYKRVQRRKQELYQGALDSIEKGELSAALTKLEKVIEFDAQAPDTMAPEREKLYERVRSEHQEVNEQYDEAKRLRAEGLYREALEVCDRMLGKFPGHALFSALKLDLDVDQSQALSAYIAEVDVAVQKEPDLEAQAKALDEACRRYPDEPRFQQRLKTVKSKADLVKSIVLRARGYEAGDRFQEAQVQWQTLRTVYPEYPGLDHELDRIAKRLELQASGEAKARWVERVEAARRAGQWDRAAELVAESLEEFADDAELIELRNIVAQGGERAAEAAELFASAQANLDDPDPERGAEAMDLLRQAYGLDPGNYVVSSTLFDALIKKAQGLIDADYRAAEPFAREAMELRPDDNVASGLITLIRDRSRSESVDRWVSEARQLQGSGDLDQALSKVRDGLAQFPRESRLSKLEATLSTDLREATTPAARARDEPLSEGITEYIGPAQVKGAAVGDETVYMPRGARPEEGAKARAKPAGKRAGGKRAKRGKPRGADREAKKPASKRAIWIGSAAALACGALIAAIVWWATGAEPAAPTPSSVAFSITSTPSGSTVRVDDREVGTTPHQIELEPGPHQIEIARLGYASISRRVEVETPSVDQESGEIASTPIDNELNLELEPLPALLRVLTDLDNAQITVDGENVGSVEEGQLDLANLEAGEYEVAFASGRAATASFTFETVAGEVPKLLAAPATRNVKAVAVSALGPNATVYGAAARVLVDGEARGEILDGRLELTNLQPGVRELTLESDDGTRTLLVELGPLPSLAVFLSSDRDAGDLYITAGETDVEVLVDGRRRNHSSRNGQIRLYNLRTGTRKIEIRKAGFRIRPGSKTVSIVKGQIARTSFEFEKIPQVASLEISGATPGIQVYIDGESAGVVAADGSLRLGDVAPGARTIELRRKGYRPKSLRRDIAAEGRLELVAADVALELAKGSIAFTVEPDQAQLEIEPAIMDAGSFEGKRRYDGVPKTLELQTGTYNLTITAPGREPYIANLQLADGEVKSITKTLERARLTPQTKKTAAVNPMDRFDGGRSGWRAEGGWYVRKGSAVVPYAANAKQGRFAFTTKLPSPVIGSGKPVSWAVGFKDAQNYLVFELNKKNFKKSVVKSSTAHEVESKPHGLDSKQRQAISVEVRGATVTVRVGGKVLDQWTVADPASLDGRFAFVIPGGKDLEIKDFSYRP